MENLQQLQKLAQIFNADKIITPEDINRVREILVGILANNKKELTSVTEETKQLLQSVLEKISEEHDTYLNKTEKIAQELKSDTTEALNSINKTLTTFEEVKLLCKEVMDCKPENGKDADEEYVIEEVLNRIKLPEYKEVVLDDGSTIVDKINSLPVNEANQIDAKHIKNLPETKTRTISGGVTRKIVEQMIAAAEGAEGGGGTPGGSTTQLQYNNAGAFGGISGATTNGTAVTYTTNNLIAADVTASSSAGLLLQANNGTDVLLLGAGGSSGATFYGGVNVTGDLTVDTDTLDVDTTNNRIGILTTAPTHSLTLGSTSTGISLYNTADQTTNYERGILSWSSNILTLLSENAGTGTARAISLQAKSATTTSTLTINRAALPLFNHTFSSATGAGNYASFTGTFGGTSTAQVHVAITPTISQSSTAGYTALLVNPTESTTGSGTKLLMDLQVGGTTKFYVDNSGTARSANGNYTSPTNAFLQATSASVFLRPTAQNQNNALKVYAGTNGTKLDFHSSAAANSGVENLYYNGVGILQTDADLRLTTARTNTASIVTVGGTQTLTNKTLTAPKFADAGFIADANGNEEIIFTTTASAVNEITLANAATGNAPSITASGGDTNIDLKIGAKGTGEVKHTTATYQDLVAATDGVTVTFDVSDGNIQTVTLGGNRTLAISNAKVGQVFMLRLQQDGTGSRTVTWFTTIKWAGGSAPTLTTTASKADILGFLVTSAGNYDGFVVGQNI